MQLVLIDTSYTSFYRFFATLRWFSMSNSEEYKLHAKDPSYNWLENQLFIKKYEKMYLESIVKLIGKKNFKNSMIVFCLDASRETLWRNKLAPHYKANRQDLSLKNDFKPTFHHTYEKIIPQLIASYSNIFQLKVKKCEGDDIIASIVMHCLDREILICSGDKDFLQLGRDNVKFINYKISKPFIITKEEASQILHEKLLLGDKSDNIDSILPTDRKILSLIERKELLANKDKFIKYIENHQDIADKYHHQQLMMDFNFIPTKYQNKIIKEFEKFKI